MIHLNGFRRLQSARISTTCILFSILAGVCASPAPALEFPNGYVPDVHNRFVPGTFEYRAPGLPLPTDPPEPNPTFWAAQYHDQLTGIGWRTDRGFRHVAMISPNHFLAASHSPHNNKLVTFINRQGELHTFITGETMVVYGDVSVGAMYAIADDPITPEGEIVDVRDYDINYFPLYVADPEFYLDNMIISYGAEGRDVWEENANNPPGHPDYVNQGPRAGVRKCHTVSTAYTIGLNQDVHLNDQDHEAGIGITGDSGSPYLFERDGQLTIVADTFTGSSGGFMLGDGSLRTLHRLKWFMLNNGGSTLEIVTQANGGTAEITYPLEGQPNEAPIMLRGTADAPDFSHYELDYYEGNFSWVPFYSGSFPVIDGTLNPGIVPLDNTRLAEGDAFIRLTVVDGSGLERETILHFTNIHGSSSRVHANAIGGPYEPSTGDAGEAWMPTELRPHESQPNPFRSETRIWFDLAQATETSLVIYDVRGRAVRTLVDKERLPAGRHWHDWNGRDDHGSIIRSGVYFSILQRGSHVEKRRLTLTR